MNVRHVKSFGGWKRSATCLVPVLAVLFTFYSQCQGQQASAGSIVPADSNIRWAVGPQKLSLGDYADIDVPAGYRMTDAHGARIILDSLNNPAPDNLIGALSDTAGKWWAVMEYSPNGFVKDVEQIDSTAVLKALQAEMQGNKQAGASLDWQSAPVYDPQMHSLSWSLQVQNGSKKELSQTVVLLGRGGFVKITSYQPADASALKQVAASINFRDGERYADFQSGDQIARMGLSDLIVGESAYGQSGNGPWIWQYGGGLGLFRHLSVRRGWGRDALSEEKGREAFPSGAVAAPACAAKTPVTQPVAAVKPSIAQPAVAATNGNGHQNGADCQRSRLSSFTAIDGKKSSITRSFTPRSCGNCPCILMGRGIL